MIRNYEVRDRAKLLEVLERNVPTYFDAAEVEDFEIFLDTKGPHYFVVEQEGEIVGGAGCLVESEKGVGLVRWIFFDPSRTGLGLGKAMMEHCLRIFESAASVQKLVVNTSQLSHRFFEKFGYDLVTVEKDHWGSGLDLYVMERGVDQTDRKKS